MTKKFSGSAKVYVCVCERACMCMVDTEAGPSQQQTQEDTASILCWTLPLGLASAGRSCYLTRRNKERCQVEAFLPGACAACLYAALLPSKPALHEPSSFRSHHPPAHTPTAQVWLAAHEDALLAGSEAAAAGGAASGAEAEAAEAARKVLDRALAALPKRKHIKVCA